MKNNKVTLELHKDVIARARDVAYRTQRPVEDVLSEWIDRFADELPVEMLSDEEVMALSEFEMNIIQRQELSTLLWQHRERELTRAERTRLDDLLQLYRRGLVRKARAIHVAVARGLRRPYQ